MLRSSVQLSAKTTYFSAFRMASSQALVYEKHGEPINVLKSQVIQLPELASSEVQVSILASPINPSDVNTVEGKYPIQPTMPAVPGNEGVAEVTSVGTQVTGLQKGDWVVPLRPGLGWWQTKANMPAADLFRVPQAIGLEAAATITIKLIPIVTCKVSPPTALRMLEEFETLKAGDVVIQNGASSSVGQMVMQIAADRGLRTVNLIRRNPQRLSDAELKGYGGTIITDEENVKADMDAAGLPPARLALNCVGGKASQTIAKRLGQSGTMVTYGGMSKQPVMGPTPAFIFKDLRFRGFWLSGSRTEEAKKAGAAVLQQIVDMYQQKKLRPIERDWISMDDWQEAFASERRNVMLRMSAT